MCLGLENAENVYSEHRNSQGCIYPKCCVLSINTFCSKTDNNLAFVLNKAVRYSWHQTMPAWTPLMHETCTNSSLLTIWLIFKLVPQCPDSLNGFGLQHLFTKANNKQQFSTTCFINRSSYHLLLDTVVTACQSKLRQHLLSKHVALWYQLWESRTLTKLQVLIPVELCTTVMMDN